MTAQVSIVLNEAKQALCIPVSALGEKGGVGRYTVRGVRDGRPEVRKVRIGINNNVRAQVLDGLKEGEKVIVGDSSSLPATENKGPMGGPPPPRR